MATGVTNNGVIGIFDSGIGGLTVFKAVSQLLPQYDLIYFGDMARVPYGARTPETIKRYAREVAAFLIGQGAKLVIVACNTVSSNALPVLQQEFSAVPVLGAVVPAVEEALAVSSKKRIGIIGTRATVNSGAYLREIAKRDPVASVTQKACPLLVPLIEEGWTSNLETRRIAKRYLTPLKHAQVDTLVLGCTHYPLIKPIFQDFMGPNVKIVDSATATARKLVSYLGRHPELAASLGKNNERCFFVTDAAETFTRFARRYLGMPALEVKKVDLAELEKAVFAPVCMAS